MNKIGFKTKAMRDAEQTQTQEEVQQPQMNMSVASNVGIGYVGLNDKIDNLRGLIISEDFINYPMEQRLDILDEYTLCIQIHTEIVNQNM